jgi:serine phosphatase RsbU (regulator of sigma subunit)
MELEARRFARKVLLIHAALLIVVLLIMGSAVRVLYAGARDRAIEQAKENQEVLARQTAQAIENYYESVTGVLNLLQPADGTPNDKTVDRPSETVNSATWVSIQDKASLLMVLDQRNNMRIVRVIGASDQNAPDPKAITDEAYNWLLLVSERAISPYLRLSNQGMHLVAVPLRGQAGRLMVAAIPVSALEQAVLGNVNRSDNTTATLIDDAGTFISARLPGAVGKNINEFDDPRMRELARKYSANHFEGTEIFHNQERIGDVTFQPGISSIKTVKVLDRTWQIVVTSTLQVVDGFVGPIFRDAMLWGTIVMVAMTGLSVSTAFQLIRSRLRLERMQSEMLAKEMSDAREIQLNWLPKGTCVTETVQVAALNQPATHISGDFYNWFVLDDGRIVVTIGDVTGHGMSAAFLMATTQLLVKNIMPRVAHAGECLDEINKQLVQQSFNGQFVTLLICVIDPCRGTMEIANAGHPPPLIGQGGHFEQLQLEPQLVLGVNDESTYFPERFDLMPYQSIVLYTDGAIDAQRPDGERFSIEGLAKSLFGRFDSAEAIITALQHAVDEFRQGRDLPDDLTLVAIQLNPTVSATTDTESEVAAPV